MPATNAARDFLAAATVGEATTDFTTSTAYLGVGDSTAAFAATQTDLQAATNKLRRPMQSGYPQRAGNVLTFQALFTEGEANFAWQEVAVFNAAAGGVMLHRKVQSLGTKPASEQWRLTITSSFGVA